jgi:hypothetical protein
MESEFVSAAREIQEAMGCNHLVKEMGQSLIDACVVSGGY